MSATSIERILDWLSKNRNETVYAFRSIDIALSIGAPPADIDMLCNSAADGGMIASVFVGNDRYFTHPTVGLEQQVGKKRLKVLEERTRVVRIGDHWEWTPPQPKPVEA